MTGQINNYTDSLYQQNSYTNNNLYNITRLGSFQLDKFNQTKPYTLSNDTLQISQQSQAKKSSEKECSTGTKIAIGTGFVACLAVAADFVFAKGKHVKSILGKYEVKNPRKKSITNSKKTAGNNLPVLNTNKNLSNDAALTELETKIKKLPNYSSKKDLFKSILDNTTTNNNKLLTKYLDDPTSVKIFSPKNNKNVPITEKQLNILMQLNRNNKNIESLINSPQQLYDFINNTATILKNVVSKHPSLNQFCQVLANGDRGLSDTIHTRAKLNSNLLDDIENLAHGKSYIKKFANQNKVLENTQIGEAFSINGKMFIKEENNILTELGYDEKVFEKLFPPIDRFNTTQGSVGDCYFVSTIDSLMNTPKGRNEIYKMFRGSTENKILVNSIRTRNTFTFKRFDNNSKHIRNENGLAILEQYFATCDATTGLKNNLTKTPEEIMNSFGGGGLPYNISRRLVSVPSKNLNEFATNEQELIKMLEANKKGQNVIVNFGTIDKSNTATESVLNEKYYLYSKHAYSIKGYNANTKTVTISNPWSCGVEVEVPISELSQYINFENGVSFLNVI